MSRPRTTLDLAPAVDVETKHPTLVALGERVRTLRARRGMTRKSLASAAGVSERHLANLESGTGNASILIIDQVAAALGAPAAELIGDATTISPEWLMIRELLHGRDEADLRRARGALSALFGGPHDASQRRAHIALIGLRGAGKSTLGRMLAHDLDVPFIELSREIERLAGCSISEIHALYGTSAYRRYERRALQDAIASHGDAVIATPGGVVSDPATFELVLAQCFTVWLRALPQDHMQRVAEQGDLRPMEASSEAMEDLRRILVGREAFYAKADLIVNTSAQPLQATFDRLRQAVRLALHRPS